MYYGSLVRVDSGDVGLLSGGHVSGLASLVVRLDCVFWVWLFTIVVLIVFL